MNATAQDAAGSRQQPLARPTEGGDLTGAGTLRGDYGHEIDRLVLGYNFPDRWYADVFVDLLQAVIRAQPDPTVLDVGCGRGIFHDRRYQERLRPGIGRYIGVEPDRTVAINTDLFDEVHSGLVEHATIPDASIDIAYAAMVAEHVTDPDAFLQSIARYLRPGGCLLICTPNAKSYFGSICAVVRWFGMEDWLLRRIVGAESADGYHYPTAYRMNTASDLKALADRAGLDARVGYTEAGIACHRYFPGPLKPLWALLKLKRKAWKKPHALTHIIAVFEKAS